VKQLPLGVRLRERSTFDAFLAGPNGEAVMRLRALAQAGRGVVWLCGPAGSGRTHLLQATCAGAGPGRRAAYLSLGAMRDAGPALLAGAGALDLMCLDDVDAVAGEPGFARGLFTLYRDLEERGAALVVAAGSAPQALIWALPDIGSRFAAAEVFQIRPLDDDDQAAALRLRASLRGIELPEDVARYLQRRYPRDMPTLAALLDRIDSAALSAQRRITLPFIREILGEPRNPPPAA
jgi:DnaA family protein